jgi:GGDEF domain-containing protein
MDKLAFGFWGGFFGLTALMLMGSVLAYVRSLRRIAINAALSSLASAFLVLAFLDGLPFENPASLCRFLAHVATLVSVLLTYFFLSLLGLLESGLNRRQIRLALGGAALVVIASGWMMEPLQALALGEILACSLGVMALGLCLESVNKGDRRAIMATIGVFFMLLALCGLSWIALHRDEASWQLHAASAVAATLYLTTMAWFMWSRYAYLAELHEVMAHGPSYDPVTRLRSQAETGQMVGALFNSFRSEPSPMGLIVLTIANLYALEKLHGAVAISHALFVTAGRLRRIVPAQVEMGRLGTDGFVLIMRNCRDSGQLINLARNVTARLRKPVALHTSRGDLPLEAGGTVWGAEVGVGVLLINNPGVTGSSALAMARKMARTAMSYASRIAWFDQTSGEIAELPVPPAS